MCSRASVMRSRHRYSFPPSRRCLRAVTWSGRQRPGRGRRPPSRFLSSSGYSGKGDGQSRSPWCSCRRASSRCRWRRRSTATGTTWVRVCLPVYGGAADRPAAPGAQARRRRRGGDAGAGARPHPPRHARSSSGVGSSCSTRPTRCSTWASPRTSRRSSRRPPSERQTVLFSATMPPRIDAHRPPAPARPGADRDRHAATAAAGERRWCARGVRRAARAQDGGARTGARPGDAGGGDRLLPDARRGRRAHRDAEGARLPRRGAARRDGPGRTRPGDEPAARPAPPTCSSPPTSPRAASTSISSPTS